MRDTIEGLMLALRWLWFPLFFPLGGIIFSTLGALVTYRGAAIFEREPIRPAMFTQPWCWVGMTVLTLCVLLVIGMVVLAPWGFLVFAAWLSLPSAVIASSLLDARAARRRTSPGTDVA
jgi:hypothetical protein